MSRVPPVADLAQKTIATSTAINMARDMTYGGGGSRGSLGPLPPGLPGLVLRDPASRLMDEEGRIAYPWLGGLMEAEGGRTADSGRGGAADPGRP